MKKIKDFFVNASERLVKVAKRFPVTFVVILITTIYMYIEMQFEVFDDEEKFGKILITLITFGMGTLFVETFDKKKEMFTYVGYVIALGISVTYYFLFGIENAMEMQRYLLVRLLGVYLTSLGFATIFVLHRKTDLSFKEYAVKVFSNLLKTSIYYGVFCIGTITIFIIFEVLIFSNGFDVYFNLLFLTFGIFYTPLVINCFVDLEEKIAGFLRGLITFVLYPIAIFYKNNC